MLCLIVQFLNLHYIIQNCVSISKRISISNHVALNCELRLISKLINLLISILYILLLISSWFSTKLFFLSLFLQLRSLQSFRLVNCIIFLIRQFLNGFRRIWCWRSRSPKFTILLQLGLTIFLWCSIELMYQMRRSLQGFLQTIVLNLWLLCLILLLLLKLLLL